LLKVTKAFTGGFRIRDRSLISPSREMGTTASNSTLADSEVGKMDEEAESRDTYTMELPSHKGKEEDSEEKRISRALNGINSRYIEFTKRLFRSHSTNSLSEKASSSDAHVSASCQGSSARGSSSTADSQKLLRKSQSTANLSSTSHTSKSTKNRSDQENEVEMGQRTSESHVAEDVVDFKGVAEVDPGDQIAGYPETPDIKKYLQEVTECLMKVTQSMENPNYVPIPSSVHHDDSIVRKTVSFDDHPGEQAHSEIIEDPDSDIDKPPDNGEEAAESLGEDVEDNVDGDQEIPSLNTTLMDITNKYLSITAFLLDPLPCEDAESLDEVSKASTVIENKTSSLSKDDVMSHEQVDDVDYSKPMTVPETASVCDVETDEKEDSELVPDIKIELVKFANEFVKINRFLGKLIFFSFGIAHHMLNLHYISTFCCIPEKSTMEKHFLKKFCSGMPFQTFLISSSMKA